MKVLLVDDDVIVSRGLRNIIPWQELGAEVIGEARNGKDALEIALRLHPDLIITDIKMPIMDGLELCCRIRELMTDTAIVLLSAHEEFDYARQAMQYGVDTYIVKPMARKEISQLTTYIQEISRRKNEKLHHYSSLFNRQLEINCYEALKTGNTLFFKELFEQQLALSTAHHNEIKELCMRLLTILFDFYQGVGGDRASTLLQSKSARLDDLYNLKTRHEAIAFTYDLFRQVNELATEKKEDRQHSLVQYVKQYVHDNIYNVNLSLADIAYHMERSPAYLSAVFSQNTGVKLNVYITQKRIDQARQLLLDPSLPIYSISEKLGFQDPHYFARVFKKVESITPSEYRNLYLNHSVRADAEVK
ncbi:response regulator [Paenibacillus nicotianae]|uniref:Response regulator n=1 Tax=Paenibacillus nicotianae TaxID=1526551 RepID=A0ABW4V209_9BACL